MKRENIFFRIYQYQKERFPLLVLILTTFAIILSTVFLIEKNLPKENYFLNYIFPLISGIIFMFNIRVLDEEKDLKFDNRNHPERAIQRGLIDLKELKIINFIFIILVIFFSHILNRSATLFLILSLGYSFFAGNDFFYKKIRNNFLLYNFLCLIQICFFQIYLYQFIGGKNYLFNGATFFHLLFVFSTSAIIEVGRKIKVENIKKDTYSFQIGRKASSILFILISLSSYILFLVISILFNVKIFFILPISILFLIILFLSIWYINSKNKLFENILTLFALVYYLSLHLLISFSFL